MTTTVPVQDHGRGPAYHHPRQMNQHRQPHPLVETELSSSMHDPQPRRTRIETQVETQQDVKRRRPTRSCTHWGGTEPPVHTTELSALFPARCSTHRAHTHNTGDEWVGITSKRAGYIPPCSACPTQAWKGYSFQCSTSQWRRRRCQHREHRSPLSATYMPPRDSTVPTTHLSSTL